MTCISSGQLQIGECNALTQGTPNVLNMLVANIGKPAPSHDRKNVFAAMAELAFTLYTCRQN